MHGSFINIFGGLYILFIVSMFVGVIVRTGFGNMLKSFLGRFVGIFCAVMFFLFIGIAIYSGLSNTNTFENVDQILTLLRDNLPAV
jgi:hypothetical protein